MADGIDEARGQDDRTQPRAPHATGEPSDGAIPPTSADAARAASEAGQPESEDPPVPGTTDVADGGEAAKDRAKPEPIRSLVDLFTVKGASAGKLLRELEKGTSWKFADEDVQACLALVPEQDANLVRTRQLLYEAIETRDGRFAWTAGDFILSVLAPDVDGLPSWPPEADTDPVQALRELAGRLQADLRGGKQQRRAHNVLMIGVDLLSHRRGLAFESAAPVLREALGRPPEYERERSNPRRHRIASVTLPRNNLERVRDLLDLLEPWERELDQAQRAGQDSARQAREARLEAEDSARRLRELKETLAELQSDLEQARQDAEASRDRVQHARVHASADVTELRARSVAFLNIRLRDLIATAKEASEVEPPRTPTTLRLLEQAIQELRKEVEWLKSSA